MFSISRSKFILVMWILFLLVQVEDALKPPKSLTAIVVGNKATICWLIDEASEAIRHFQITYEIISSSGNFVLQIKKNIDGLKRSYTIRGLIPVSTYKIFMVTIGSKDVSNASATLEFTTNVPDNHLIRIERNGVYPEEIVFISIVVIIWMIAVVVFLRQWNSIRILEPTEPRYRHAPKNLETIRVVKRTQDSVIYKGYSRKLSITMVEREKRRLQRMNTAPVLPVTGRMTLNTLPTIHMEDMTTEM